MVAWEHVSSCGSLGAPQKLMMNMFPPTFCVTVTYLLVFKLVILCLFISVVYLYTRIRDKNHKIYYNRKHNKLQNCRHQDVTPPRRNLDPPMPIILDSP